MKTYGNIIYFTLFYIFFCTLVCDDEAIDTNSFLATEQL